MSWLAHEWRLLSRSRLALINLLLLMSLSALAVVLGILELSRQEQTIARLAELQAEELAAQQPKLTQKGDVGTVAYYASLVTWDEPAPAAFLALGLRDTAPYVLRVRALALQAQLHEGEVFNPELALVGRFDFAFVLVYLAPLFMITLLYDLVSGERHAGRLPTLLALTGNGRWLWWRRAALRAVCVFVALALPLLAGAWASAMPAIALATTLGTVLAYVSFWTGLSLAVSSRRDSSVNNATALMSCWAVLTVVLPTVGHALLAQAVPVRQGVDLMLAQRQEVHSAWDLPRDETMERFYLTHPEWQKIVPLPAGFHWKWYFAFQQLGDENVADQVTAYRAGLMSRQRWTERLGWILPGVGVQTVLHRVASTDLHAQLDYQDEVANFHKQLRLFYYPYLFNEVRFEAKDFEQLPRFQSNGADKRRPDASLLALALVALAATLWGLRASRNAAG